MCIRDRATWTVLLITLSGLIGAVTPVGRMAGSTELSNLLLYSVVALLASRARDVYKRQP